MRVGLEEGRGDNAPRRTGRAAVVVMGAPLETRHVAAVAAAIADHGANIDRIRRLSRYPVTTVELDVSGADVGDLRHALALVAAETGADIAVAPAGLARRGGRLVVMDVDSTLIQDEVIELLAEHAGRAGEVAAVTEAGDARRARLRAEPARPGRDARRACPRPCSTRCGMPCASPRAPAPSCAPSSASASPWPSSPAASSRSSPRSPSELGVDHVRANRLEVVDGHLTGRVAGRRRRPRRQGRRPAGVRRPRGAAALPDRRHRRRRQRPRHARGRRARRRLQRQAARAPPGRHRAHRARTSTPSCSCWGSRARRSRTRTRATTPH